MLKEQTTTYAYKLKYLENPTFDRIRAFANTFINELPTKLTTELYDSLNRGTDLLDSEPSMLVYLFSFGKMHQAKLNYAFSKIPDGFMEQSEINIIDYGCGQAVGTMCYADYLKARGNKQKIKSITLIEPSEICLKRAALHASVFFPDAEITTINKKFDELDDNDISTSEDTPTLHMLSNVLDLDFDLQKFSELIKSKLVGYNQFVCVDPYFGYSDKDQRMNKFANLIGGNISFSKILEKGELNPDKNWTCQTVILSVGEMEEELSTEVTDEEIQNGITDEDGVVYSRDGKRLLRCVNKDLENYDIHKCIFPRELREKIIKRSMHNWELKGDALAALSYPERAFLMLSAAHFKKLLKGRRYDQLTEEEKHDVWDKRLNMYGSDITETIVTTKLLKEINSHAKNGGGIELHFYTDEYQMPITIAEYDYGESRKNRSFVMLWTNINAPVRETIKSINVLGMKDGNSDAGFVEDVSLSFDYLFNKYPRDYLK